MSRLPAGTPQRATLDASPRDAPDWRWDLDLTDPRQAYAAGCVDGYLRRCAEEDAEADAIHRAAVENAIRILKTVDARRASDRGELAA